MISHVRRPSTSARAQCRNSVILLSVLWMLGLVCGLYYISSADSFLLDSFYTAPSCRPTIVGIFIVTLLPIALSAIAVYFSASAFIFILCFFKAFGFGAGICGIIAAFGYSGWLIQLLLLFSDTCMAVLLFRLWCTILSRKCYAVMYDLLICTALAAAIGIVDYFIVSPYLAALMNYS